jgi:hypothetical protein
MERKTAEMVNERRWTNMTQNVDEELKSKNCNLLKWVGHYELPICWETVSHPSSKEQTADGNTELQILQWQTNLQKTQKKG